MVLLLGTDAAHAGGLRALAFHEFPTGVYTAIVINEATAPMPLLPARLERATDAAPVHTWWIRAVPETLAPGQRGLLRFSLMRAKSRQDAVIAHFAASDSLGLHRGELTIAPIHLVADSSTGKLYTYLRNLGAQTAVVSRLTLEDVPLVRTGSEPLSLAAGQTGVWVSDAPPWDTQPSGLDVILSMEVNGLTTLATARVFDHATYRFRWEDGTEDFVLCPTHQLGAWTGVGRKIFGTLSGAAPAPGTVHFCRNRLPDGLAAFGACAPRAVANLQASNLDRGKDNPWPGWHAIAAIVKAAVAPGIFTALIEDASQFSGAYGQPASPADPPLREGELRPLLYLSLAAGSKGLLIRPPLAPAEVHATPPVAGSSAPGHSKFEALLTELNGLLPRLAISEPAPGAVSANDAATQAQALLCGEQGLLIVAHRFGEPAQPSPLKLRVTVPPGCPPLRHWREIGGSAAGELVQVGHGVSLEHVMESELMVIWLSPVA
jgi:hypothetical protein